ncbi:regulatory protein, luxR family [Tangfeifania diversioriginum]|uniref:Regulatory protein, luxR family n=1 Tax=Tangfeifania diversioriginum TaxID=1168035 RepID=A0A1M6IX42_9BACT|nr:helix-turn-helix transcriptional regulator [Tangfeifania diversioriginum]SHJ39003.1 regulatory protein, luxR family [Tangfeifania diversioriginum]
MYFSNSELVESLQRDFILPEKKQRGGAFIYFAESMPGFAHFNCTDTFQMIYVNNNFSDYFGLSPNEIIGKDIQFFREHYCFAEWKNKVEEIVDSAERDDEQKFFLYIQKIRKTEKSEYRDFICFTQWWSSFQCFLTYNIPVDNLGNGTKIINRFIERNEFIRNNYKKFASLTNREIEILRLIGAGKSRNEIAKILYISKHTIDNHRKHIRHKLEIKSTADLFRYIYTFSLV